jgi:hypothetical protein
MAGRQASGQRERAAERREDSRERQAEEDSNSVSVEPWEEQPDGQRVPCLRLSAPGKSRAAALNAVLIQRAPAELLVS